MTPDHELAVCANLIIEDLMRYFHTSNLVHILVWSIMVFVMSCQNTSKLSYLYSQFAVIVLGDCVSKLS